VELDKDKPAAGEVFFVFLANYKQEGSLLYKAHLTYIFLTKYYFMLQKTSWRHSRVFASNLESLTGNNPMFSVSF
jgi:hypothetical protein